MSAVTCMEGLSGNPPLRLRAGDVRDPKAPVRVDPVQRMKLSRERPVVAEDFPHATGLSGDANPGPIDKVGLQSARSPDDARPRRRAIDDGLPLVFEQIP